MARVPGGPVAGLGVGPADFCRGAAQLLDQWLGTLPTFTLGLLTLGIGLGYYNLLRFIRRIDRRDRQAQEAADETGPEP